jgi:pimeloyl-ACP methyl ester carboxylesterase
MAGFQNLDVALWAVLFVVISVAWLAVPYCARAWCPERCALCHRGREELEGTPAAQRATLIDVENPALQDGGRSPGGAERSGGGQPPKTRHPACCGGTCGLGPLPHGATVCATALVVSWVATLVLIVALLGIGWRVLYSAAPASDCQPTPCASSDLYCCSYSVPAGQLGGAGYPQPRDVWLNDEIHAWLMVNETENDEASLAPYRERGEAAWNATGGGGGAGGWLNIFYAHGSGANIATQYRIARYESLLRLGRVRIFAYDYPGYGKSKGEVDAAALLSSSVTAMLAFRWIVRQSGDDGWVGGPNATAALRLDDSLWPSDNRSALANASAVVPLGFSMGGPTVAHVLGQSDAGRDARALVFESSFSSLRAAITDIFPVTGFAGAAALIAASGSEMDAQEWIQPWARDDAWRQSPQQLPQCVFQAHSRGDEWAPFPLAQELFAAIRAPAGPPPAQVPVGCSRFYSIQPPETLHTDPITEEEEVQLQRWMETQRERLR